MDSLRERVGGIITLSNLATDLQISPKTAKSWLSLIEKMYIAFSVTSYTKNVSRAIIKPPKVYFYDNADTLNTEGSRLENLIATTLLKRLHFNDRPFELIEVKQSDTTISTSLKYYSEKLKPKYTVQIVGNLERPFNKNGVLVTNPMAYFKNPPLENFEPPI